MKTTEKENVKDVEKNPLTGEQLDLATESEKAEQNNANEQLFIEVESQRGTPYFMKEGEIIEGIMTCEEGRLLGDKETRTLELFNKNKGIILIPINVVIDGKLDLIKEKMGVDNHYLRITYKGKKESKNKMTYKDYRIEVREATQDELIELAQYESL